MLRKGWRGVTILSRSAWWSISGKLPDIGFQPTLSPEAIEWLDDHLKPNVVFLEYGAGASTLYALQRCRKVISVETDARWMRGVVKAAKTDRLKALPVHIGLTKEWGFPALKRPTPKRIARWRSYVEAPWPAQPDVVLIDGRFRVACVAQTGLSAGPSVRVLFDDFFVREDAYSDILPFVDDCKRLGRALAFRFKPAFDREKAAIVRDRFLVDPL